MEQGRLRIVARALSWRPLATIAAFSYTLYLIHAQLLQVLWQLIVQPFDLPPVWQLAILWVIISPVIVLVAWIAARYMENPFVRIAARKDKAPAPEGPVKDRDGVASCLTPRSDDKATVRRLV
ncbi:hypothetical protein GORHZ_244_00130 [Gordonia rhizosphera NBRC 16068]|uniref:Acyltransferase n=1 Tax=Gordonia rhizosphera NBRC 16068 TaxID=1108045 RepID=K6W3M4_9ACTN|nr:hypothetical protein GORHZ_244_00130 [Gordonia rhizosphera NBRC 16068]